MDNFPHGFKGIKKVVIALLLSYIFTTFAVYEWKNNNLSNNKK